MIAPKDSIVTVSKQVAKYILKDLNRFDELKKEIYIYKQSDSLQAVRIKFKDSTIAIYNKQVKAYTALSANISIQKDIAVTQRNEAQYKYSEQKKKTIVSQVVGLCLFITAVLIK